MNIENRALSMRIMHRLLAMNLLAIGISVGTPVHAGTIVSSGSTLDIATEQKFDEAIVTISGPNSFYEQFNLSAGITQLRIEDLGLIGSGHYNYQIQYIQQGKIEYINDAKTGRQGAARNTGKIEMKSGYFNVHDDEFVTADAMENAAEISVSPMYEVPARTVESSAEYQQGQ